MKHVAMIVALFWLAAPAMAEERSRAPVRVYECPASDSVTDAAISPDERYLAQAIVIQESPTEVAEPRVVETIRMLDFRKECAISEVMPRSEPSGKPTTAGPRIYGLRFTGDGRMVVFSDGASLRVLRTTPMSQLWNFVIPMRDHMGWFTDVAVARDAHVAVVLARPLRPHRAPNEPPRLVSRPEFQHLFRAYDLDTGAVRSELKLPREFAAVGLALSPDGSRAAITVAPEDVSDFGKSPDLIIIDVAKGAIVNQFKVRSYGQVAFADNQTIYTLGPSSNGYRRKFRLVDINTGQVVREIAEPKDRTLAGLSASADGRFVGSSLWRSDLSILSEVRSGGEFGPDEFFMWNGASGELVARIKTSHSGALKLSPTGRFLLSGTRIFEFELNSQSIAGSH